MRTRTYLAIWTLSGVVAAAVVLACATESDTGEVVVDDAGTALPAPSVALPPPSMNEAGLGDAAADAAPRDAATDARADAGRDGGRDAGFDAGPAPEPGEPCANVDEVFKRSCGLCGEQQALCLAAADGGASPGVITEYSACANEVQDGCEPGTSDVEDCGNCGKRTRTCTKHCAWTFGSCTGEPAGACTPGSRDLSWAGCASKEVFRTRECSAACMWSRFSATCEPLRFKLDVPEVVGEKVSGVFPLRAMVVGKRLNTGPCASTTLSATTNHAGAYVELANASPKTLTVSAWNQQASSFAPIVDTLMAWYPRSTPPVGDDERKACTGTVATACPTGLPCGDSRWAGLTGSSAITIPPASSVTVWIGSYYAVGSSSSGTTANVGDVKLVVRTDAAL